MPQEELPELCEIRGDRMRGCANVCVRFARFWEQSWEQQDGLFGTVFGRK